MAGQGRGGVVLRRRVLRRLTDGKFSPSDDAAACSAVGSLTARETDSPQLMAQGWSNTEIGGHVYISGTTVKTHVSRILATLGARDRVQAVVIAYQTGLADRRSTSP